MNADAIEIALDDLLDAAVSVLTAPPARQFVAHGTWARDCESVAVEVVDWRLDPLDVPPACALVNVITLEVTVLRCFVAATGDAPIPAMSGIQADAMLLARDLAALTAGLADLHGEGLLFTDPAIDCAAVGWVNATAVGPEGGIGGWTVRMTLTV